MEIGGEEAGVSVDVGGGNLEEKLAPSSEENLIITLEGGELVHLATNYATRCVGEH